MQGRVVHVMRSPYDVYIGRGRCPRTAVYGKWGNPYSHKPSQIPGTVFVKTRAEAIERYREYILRTPELYNSLVELRGKVLGCWCYPNPCHGDVLIELANKYDG